ncbi:UBP15-like protein [Mya arenaria]|uniref:UBP15-like protein n=1 Tax=Mya arenaria TaxID=6604 RepID=A0ABY7EXZ8_MYAAR|nr:UBP15-like protein [Mya arenaria]
MVVICGRCLLQNHMKCESQLVDLNEVSHPTTDDINKLMHGLESILSDAQFLNKDVSVKRENNNLAKEDNLKAIRDFRKQIDIYFDNLQRKAEYEITQCHVKNEDVFTEQIKTCLDVKEEAQIKLKHINNILEKKQKSTIYVTKESLGIDIAILKKTLDEASRKPMGPLYEFHKNDVVQNLISTENVLGTVENVHTGSDEVTQTIRHEQVQLQDTFDGSAGKTAPKSVTVPPIEEQKSFIRNQLERPLIKGDTWNVLDEKWFKQWKSYVGYESWDNYNVGEESSNPGPIDNSPLFEGCLKMEMIKLFNVGSDKEVRLWNQTLKETPIMAPVM